MTVPNKNPKALLLGYVAEGPPEFTHFKAENLVVCTALLAYIVVASYSARLRPFWFDELSTLFITTAHSWTAMFHAIPTDGNPPLYFLMSRLALLLPIKVELALRIPSILAYAVAALAIYRFVRVSVDKIFAALSAVFFLSSSSRFAIEARPYSLLLAFTGIAVCGWQSYRRSGSRIFLAAMFGGIAGAILSNHYGVIYSILPLFVGEVAWSLRNHRIEKSVALLSAVGAATIVFTFPPMLHGQHALLAAIRSCPVFWAHPRLRDLKFYRQMVPPFIPLLAFLSATFFLLNRAVKTRHHSEFRVSHVPAEDLAIALTLGLFLPLMLLVTHFGTNYFQMRYAVGSAMGTAMLTGLGLAQLQSRWKHAASLAEISIIYCFAIGLLTLIVNASGGPDLPQHDPIFQSAASGQPIVVASALEFSPMWWYSPRYLRKRLHYLSDLRYAGQHSDLIPEYSLALERKYTPMQMDDYHSFLSGNNRFLLYCYGQPRLEWIKLRLSQDGWKVILLRSARRRKVDEYDTDPYRKLYEVSR